MQEASVGKWSNKTKSMLVRNEGILNQKNHSLICSVKFIFYDMQHSFWKTLHLQNVDHPVFKRVFPSFNVFL